MPPRAARYLSRAVDHSGYQSTVFIGRVLPRG